MLNAFKAAMVSAVCLASLVHPSPLAAEPEADQGSEGTVTILNLDSAAHTAGVAIDGPISKNAVAHALQLIRFLRPDNDELTVYLNSSGGDVSAAIELGEEVRKLSVLTAIDDHGECLGACVLVLAAGVRRSPVADKVGFIVWRIQRSRRVIAPVRRMPPRRRRFQSISPAWACRTGYTRK